MQAMSLPLLAKFLFVSSVLSMGCGSDDSSALDAAALDAAIEAIDAQRENDAASLEADGGMFAVTSSAYMEGGTIPTKYSCNGANVFPALEWGNAPSGTGSYAVVFLDTTTNFLHSAIWDIPVSRTGLPEGVEKTFEPSNVPGAKQPPSYLGTRGYAGPCPGSTHTYEQRVYAIDSETLPGLGQGSSKEQVVTAIEAAAIGSTALTASYTP